MADENEQSTKGKLPAASQPAAGAVTAPAAEEEGGHYEEVAEYRIGEGPPPLALVVMFVLIVLWASLSWIPFFGY